MKTLRVVACSALLVTLAACGGGEAPQDVADKYVGTWDSFCTRSSAASSFLTVYDFDKISHDSLRVVTTELEFPNGSCAGAASRQVPIYADRMQIVGQTTAAGWPVDMTLDWASGFKDIARVEGVRMYFGDRRVLDSQGYPLYLDDSQYLRLRY